MMRRSSRKSIIFLLLFFLFVQQAMAGITGKITGYVFSKKENTPLPGVNVTLEGTTFGAASDLNGNFTILNISPGKYNVKASMIGYTPVTINDVRVRIDQTSRVEFALEEEVLEGQTVTIVAEKKQVKEDVSTSVAALSGEEIEELPLTSVEEVVGLQAGIEDGLVIRGGDAEEALFQVDGVTLRDPRNNQPITGIALSAIHEISVERGGFNAEYGQVRSGIVNVVTKEGSKEGYHGTITLKYSPPAAKHFGLSPYDPNSMWLRPYLDDAVCWTGTENGVWDYYTQRQYPQFVGWNEISNRLFADDDSTNNLSPATAQNLFRWQHRKQPVTNQPDYNIDAGLGGPVPLIGKKLGNLRFFTSYRREREMLLIPLVRDDYVDYDWTLQLTSDITTAMKLKFSGIMGASSNVARNGTEQEYSTHYIRTPYEIAVQTNQFPFTTDARIFSDAYYCQADVEHHALAAKLTHTLSPNSFYEINLEHLVRKYQTEPTRLRNFNTTHEIVPGHYADEAPFGWSPYPAGGIDGMLMGGHTSTARDYSKISTTTLKFDLTSQIDLNNLVKAGIELVYNHLDLDYGIVNLVFPESNTYVKMNKFPLRGALYLQDKLEMKGFIANVGLRLDYHNANTAWIAVDYYDRSYFSANYDPNKSYNSEKAKSHFSLSPRLGISHPITENSKLFFNYGHFKQLPTYEQMFRMARGATQELKNIGNPNLSMSRTVSYELGYDHALYDTYLIQLAAFYHDITDQQAFTRYISADESINYLIANNNSYEDIRGFEATIRKSTGKWWIGFANYTYPVNTLGHFGKQEMYEDPSRQREYDKNTRNFYQERPIPQPYARASVSFFTPADFGPKFMELHWLADWKLNLLGDWREGWWATWNPRQDPAVQQNVQVKDWYNFRLRLMKTFIFRTIELTLILDVNNLLNTKRLSLASFYNAFDFQDYFNSLHLPKSDTYDNIVGKDRAGDYRKEGVPFQPIEKTGRVSEVKNPNPLVIYYERSTGKYMNFISGKWSEVENNHLDQILDDKAYIDMPNQTSFNFLNPRQIFFGIRTSFKLH